MKKKQLRANSLKTYFDNREKELFTFIADAANLNQLVHLFVTISVSQLSRTRSKKDEYQKSKDRPTTET